MKLDCFRVRNFRRLNDVLVDLEAEISIFVGANNSGKTSATQVVQLFLAGDRNRMALHDFSASSWEAFDTYGQFDFAAAEPEATDLPQCPSMSVDFWFGVDQADLHRVINLLPHLDWVGTRVGLRVELAPSDPVAMLANFREARDKAQENHRPATDERQEFHPWPKKLTEYLERRLKNEFEFRYYVLDPAQFDESMKQREGYQPTRMATDRAGGASILGKLIRIDSLSAQRHLSEESSNRAENLSRHLSRFYTRNLEQLEADFAAMGALADSQSELDKHLKKVFGTLIAKLAELGYPGLDNPVIEIRSAFDPASMLGAPKGANVYYGVDLQGTGETSVSLPDHYNGLGFKNLIYMVVQLLDYDSSWRRDPDRAPLHLVFIEEPEAHMHAQLQQVFIREILKVLNVEGEAVGYKSQFVVTTHSAHVLYERGFKPIRYFRRGTNDRRQMTDVVNLSAFYESSDPIERDFLERYLKLTHCDIFFADAAILVEGNVERLLIPLMIQHAAPRLQQSYLSVLEVGGAYGFRFKSLIECLGITTLLITDIDSIQPLQPIGANGKRPKSKACPVSEVGARTSNQTLVKWLPRKRLMTELTAASPQDRTQNPDENSQAAVYVVYQMECLVKWQRDGRAFEQIALVGRTLEESIAHHNFGWCQDEARQTLRLQIRNSDAQTLAEVAKKVGERIVKKGFAKTDFALALMHQSDRWNVPNYIDEGLKWLEARILPPPPPRQAAEGTPGSAAPVPTTVEAPATEVTP